MNVLDLFSGIGGFSLGLERAGMHTVAFCECDEFCQRVLRKHWATVPIYPEITELCATRLARDGIDPEHIHVICGGFPCQDLSKAGRGAGLAGERSGLWSEFARLIREVRPRYAIVENVSALLSRGAGTVFGELAALGYDAEWHCIPACAVGADHERDRVWIVAYPERIGVRDQSGRRLGASGPGETEPANNGAPQSLADANESRLERRYREQLRQCSRERALRSRSASAEDSTATAISRAWFAEPRVGRVADGVPYRVDRLRALGNAVVPQIPEMIGRAIMSMEAQRKETHT